MSSILIKFFQNTGASSSHRESSAFATCFASISGTFLILQANYDLSSLDIEKQSDGLFSETSNTSYRQQEITNKSAAESIFTMDPHSDGFFDLGFPTPLKNLDNSCWMFTSHNTFIPEQVSGVLESRYKLPTRFVDTFLFINHYL
jgi:hypothetical protein